MERSEILATMGELKLYGMKAAFDEIITTAVKRQHEPQRVVGDLLTAEISEKQARSIKYQITIAKLPLAKDIGDFTFSGTPINETLVRDLIGGNFLAHQRNVVLVGGTGITGTQLRTAYPSASYPRCPVSALKASPPGDLSLAVQVSERVFGMEAISPGRAPAVVKSIHEPES